MTPDQTSLEAQLRELQATSLDEALLARLEAAAEGNLTELSHDELRFENLLRTKSPVALAPDFLAKLEAIVRDVPFAVDEKIVLFPKASVAPRKKSNRPMWAAAAAVALIGAATALLMPVDRPTSNFASQPVPSSANISNVAAENLIPAGFNRGVSNVHDEGVVWKSNSQPHSLMRVEYIDKITLKDPKSGATYQVEQPRARYMLVPEKTD
ncbi:MAG: hypothetical protein ABIS50_14730 [Luteolibacter sp.]|uniref:hypothetical protein n=1 Tax=Luteolibacter sp. TaxID=1962973 RepID=UPI003264280E